MKQAKLRKIILTALFAALACVATMVIQIPSPLGGYFNLGDCVVLLGAFILGPAYGAAAGGIGSALADVILGYFVYAPGTLVIKGLMGFFAGLLFLAFAKKQKGFGLSLAGAVTGGVVAELIMVLGYFLYELPMYGFAACIETAVTTNLPQAAVGLVAGVALFVLLDRTKLASKMRGGALC